MTFDEFKEAMKREAFRKELSEYLAEKKPEDQAGRILSTIEFAALKGYTVTAEDLSLEQVRSIELNDDDLEQAAGGDWCWSDYSCIAISHYDGCDAVMNTCYSTAAKEEETREHCGQVYIDKKYRG